MNHAEEVLSVRGLTVLFATTLGWVTALEQVDIGILAGERVAVMGASGSGKTTLIRAVLGILRGEPGITGGGIRLFGREVLSGLSSCCRLEEDGRRGQRITKDIARWQRHLRRNYTKALRQRTSAVFQDSHSSLEPWKSVRKQLPNHNEDAEAWLRRFNLTPPERFLDAYPYQLSAGEAARVALVRGLMAPHDLFVADEPTSFLDAYTESVVLDVLQEVFLTPGRTLILVTHNADTARRLCHRGILLREGRSEPITWDQAAEEIAMWETERKS